MKFIWMISILSNSIICFTRIRFRLPHWTSYSWTLFCNFLSIYIKYL